MPFELDENRAFYQIRAYKPGVIKVNDKIFTKSLIITPTQLIENWDPQSVNELSFTALSPVIKLKPDILLIGTGNTQVFLPLDTYGELINHGMGVEVMNTSAACRTFNALSSENRNVVAALIIK